MDNHKILIVDDEPNILTALDFLISTEGYTVALAASGEDALAKIDDFKPNVVVLDVMMPGIDGFSVAKQIRNNPKFNNTSILFLTAKGEANDRMTGYATGAETYLTKPFDNRKLLDTIASLVGIFERG